MENEEEKTRFEDGDQLKEVIRMACQTNLGVMNSQFLCKSVGSLNPSDPVCVGEESSIHDSLAAIKDKRVGCVLVVGRDDKLKGIFTERDYITKVFDADLNLESEPISTVMTPDPLTQRADETLAFTLSLMSQGGFRHIPIVDQYDLPIGILSIRDIVDYIVKSFIEDLSSL